MIKSKCLHWFKILVPELVSANTNAATVMIGERGADFIKEDYREKNKNWISSDHNFKIEENNNKKQESYIC